MLAAFYHGSKSPSPLGRGWGEALLPHHKHRIAKQQLPVLPKAAEDRVIYDINYRAVAHGLHTKQHTIFNFFFAFLPYEARNVSILFNGACVPAVVS